VQKSLAKQLVGWIPMRDECLPDMWDAVKALGMESSAPISLEEARGMLSELLEGEVSDDLERKLAKRYRSL